jgi:hypothetical protein
MNTVMTCGCCRKDFEEDRAQPACRACPLGAGCHLLRCPHCGFENPTVPPWLAKLKQMLPS